MKDEDLWNKILLVVRVGDRVRFKNGKSTWDVILTGNDKQGHWILVRRYIHHLAKKGSWSWNEYVQKEVRQGTLAYRNLGIVRPSQ